MNVDLLPYSLELAVAALAVIMLVADSALDLEDKSAVWGTGSIGLLLVLCGSFLLPVGTARPGDGWVLDSFALYFKQFFLGAALFTLLSARAYAPRYRHGEGELYTLVMLATVGAMSLTSTRDWVSLFVGLETMTIALFVLVSWSRRDTRSLEAGMKYVIVATFSSAFLLYGIAYLYGFTGTTNLGYLNEFLRVKGNAVPTGVLFGVLLVTTGLAFKMAAFPFHMWAPDVYEGAPTPVTGFLGVASKGAGFVLAMRLLVDVMGPIKIPVGLGSAQDVPLMAVLAGLTLAYGSLAAIPQWNVKRLMGYSSISHAGYLMMGLAVAGSVEARQLGMTAVAYYLMSYLFTNYALFLVLSAMDRYTGDAEMESLAGLGRRSPLLGMTLTLAMLSLAGIPPLSGFFGKFLLLLAAFKGQLYWLVGIGLVMVVVSMYVYLNVVKQIYAVEPNDPSLIEVDGWTSVGCLAACLGMVVMGVLQAPFFDTAELAAQSLLR